MPQPDPYPPRAVGHQPVAQVASPPVRARGALVLSAVPCPTKIIMVGSAQEAWWRSTRDVCLSGTRVASCPTTS
jgi:hypothetical protein